MSPSERDDDRVADEWVDDALLADDRSTPGWQQRVVEIMNGEPDN